MRISLDTVLVVDLEATCWDTAPPEGQQSEIIEIGIAVVDPRRRRLMKSESILVRPVQSEVSKFCTELTGHTQKRLDHLGVDYFDACAKLAVTYNAKKRIWMSWGEYDRKMFEKNPETYPFSDSHINLKNLYALLYNIKRPGGLAGALAERKMEFKGTPHLGIDDAVNTAQVFIRCLEDMDTGGIRNGCQP